MVLCGHAATRSYPNMIDAQTVNAIQTLLHGIVTRNEALRRYL